MPRYRRSFGNPFSSTTRTTTVTIHWSMKSSAFAIKFSDTKHWNEMKILIQYLKNIPYGEKDYDPDNKVWYLMEQHLPLFKQMVEMLPKHFTVDFQPKPENETFKGSFVSVDTYLDKFKTLTGTDPRPLDYIKAKKIYRHACIQNHPDKGGDSKVMSEINECWSVLERMHFKEKKETEYAST